MNSLGRSLVATATQSPPHSLVTVQQRSADLGFPLRILGRSDAPIRPQVVGPWWLEHWTPETEMPIRARQRLDALLATGFVPKAIVVFHELPRPDLEPSVWALRLTRAGRWLGQATSMLAMAAASFARTAAPVVGQVLLGLAGLLVMAVGGLALVLTALASVDPCLVVVTEDGYWIEIDRWYS